MLATEAMAEMEAVMAFVLKDHQRAAFGLGWEHHRRGLDIDSNPFECATRQWYQFREGHNDYTEPEPGTELHYDDPSVQPALDGDYRE